MAKKHKLLLKIVFDTNVIYNDTSSELFRKEIIELFDNHSSPTDLDIFWYLPEVVKNERLYQMTKKGNELLPPIQKLEKLLGHQLNITADIIEQRVNDAVKMHLVKNNVLELKLDPTNVDWEKLIYNSTFRIAPFEGNDGKEKGFRDAIILESLWQLIQSSPTSKSVCRIFFLTGDGPLADAVAKRTSSNDNVIIVSNVEELIGQINILSSQINEELINSISADAQKLFFIKDDKDCFYIKGNISNEIRSRFSKELSIMHIGATKRENGTWLISKPSFDRKLKQRVFWKTIITVNFSSSKTTYESATTLPITRENILSRGLDYLGGVPYIEDKDYITNFRQQEPVSPFAKYYVEGSIERKFDRVYTKEQKVGDGETRFEITWSVTLTTSKKIQNPKIEDMKYLDTVFK